jgi:hypothetical protein
MKLHCWISVFENSFYLKTKNIHSKYLVLISLEPKPTSPTKQIITSASPPLPTTNLSRPEHRNAKLEELLAEKQDESELKLSCMKLTAQDIEILVYYGLQNNKVSNIIFDITIRDWNIIDIYLSENSRRNG